MLGIPKELIDFSMWLNPLNFKVFNKMDLFKKSYQLIRGSVPVINPNIQKELSSGLKDSEHDRGLFSLRIYFYQLFNFNAFSLDLRKSRFEYTDAWLFKGEQLSFSFKESFIQSLRSMYSAFYEEGGSLQESLEGMGLIQSDWTESEKEELTQLFYKHFQGGKDVAQAFSLQDLQTSFANIFVYIKDREGKVPVEFALIGVYITSLYLNLDDISEPFDVYSCFKFVRNLN